MVFSSSCTNTHADTQEEVREDIWLLYHHVPTGTMTSYDVNRNVSVVYESEQV